MNPTDEPLGEHVLDELLSADLDGELSAAAADLGLSVEEAEVAISSPDAAARRAALVRASEVVGAPVPLEPVATERLVTASITESRNDDELVAARRRRERRRDTSRRVMVAAGSAAAVIAVIVGLANMPSSSEDRASMSAGPTIESADSSNGAAKRTPVALGDVSDDEQLRRRLALRLRLPDTPKGLASATTSAPQEGSSPPPTGDFATDNRNEQQQYRSARVCAAKARTAAGGRVPVLTGSAVSQGRPVTVYAFRRGSGYAVLVVGRNCSVVSRLTLP